ncbi:ATP-binding cassette domain-containing protein [Undibacterium sp. SXout7W]|uniref:ABC transporter ATP-binding protein n=1 Tax=Undibacterium sp. SXout7W TaxID=3413049 RepID=UPI003BF06CD9
MIIVRDLHKEFIRRGAGRGFSMAQIVQTLQSLRLRGAPADTVKAVDGIHFSAADACITGLLGANGAGKTSTLRMIAALLSPDAGQITMDGVKVEAGMSSTQSQMGVLSDARGLYPRLTARENIQYYGLLHGMSLEQVEIRTSQLAQWLEMSALLDRRTEGFSQGERMKTALARALVHDPQNIILDEPTNGLDVVATRGLREFLRFLRSPEGGSKCILFSTHIMQEVERLCDHVVIVANGRTVSEGSVVQLMQQAGVNNFEDAFVALAFGSSDGMQRGQQ